MTDNGSMITISMDGMTGYEEVFMEHKDKTKGLKIVNMIVAIFIMLLFGLIGIFAARLYNNIQDKNSYREQGILHYNNGDYAKAAANFQTSLSSKVLFSEPLDRDTRLYLADAYFRLQQYEFAIHEYDTLLETEEEQIAYMNLQKQMAQGFIDFNEHNYEAALPAFQAAIENGHIECTLYAGVCAVQLGRREESVAYLTTYLSHDPESAYACTQLADYYLQQGLYDTCNQYLQQGLQSGDRSCDEQLLFVEIVYYEYRHDYNKAYELICSYMQQFNVTEQVQREYDFLSTRQTIE